AERMLGRASSSAGPRPALARRASRGQDARSRAPDGNGDRVDVMAPSRHRGVPGPAPESVPRTSRAKISRRRFPSSWHPGRNWDSFWDTAGPAHGCLGEVRGQLGGERVGVATAGEAPLAVVVELGGDLPAGKGDAGGPQRLERGGETRALRRE